MDWKRIAAVTAGLAAASAVVAGVLGALFVAAVILVFGGPVEVLDDFETVLRMGVASAKAGAVAGPLGAWLLMRQVPLGLAIGGTALGALAGATLAILLAWAGVLGSPDVAILFPYAGFGLSALALRTWTARGGRVDAAPRVSV